MDQLHTQLRHCLRRMLEPIVRFCLKRSLGVQEVLEELKYVFLKVGAEQITNQGQSVNVSRLSAMTGLHRRDVRRIHNHEQVKDAPQSILSRVIGRWQTDPKFSSRPGRPRVLKLSESHNEFADLLKATGSDLHPSTILNELERIGAVERGRAGVRLVKMVYSQRGDLNQAMQYLSADVRDLMQAVLENVSEQEKAPHHHGTTVFDAIDPKALPRINEWLMEQGSDLHRRTRIFLSQFDRDSNPNLAQSDQKARVVLGSFSLTSEKSKASSKERK